MEKVNCFQCKHFFVTWDQKSPRGCRAYGFKSNQLPSAVVLKTSGHPCYQFAQKPGKK
ncbi:uracil-DNA glycosylase [Bacillus wudalianchiensis]|uniref:Uracil-DNA glycosylase n=1 Tax=Pseudobacillus wudalianchiensis TaxID=1743143 RepID=A0A1B9AYI3_9BACI|nr:uracil-DNA glycosylase [Bacillus wudalianchiensis]OCA88793.1 uracil-DNA glycosylase [Bacillus wudalianchiensis]